MARKNGLNIIYDARCRRKALNKDFSLSRLEEYLDKGCYLAKNHLEKIVNVSREGVDDIIKHLKLGYKYFKSPFGDLRQWYFFDFDVMREFIAKARDKEVLINESVGKSLKGEFEKNADFHFEMSGGDLSYIISYPAGTSPEKVISGFVDWKEYLLNIGSLYNSKKPFSVKGIGGEIRGQRINYNPILDKERYSDKDINITFVDSEAFSDEHYPRDRVSREQYEFSTKVSLNFLLDILK